MTSTPTKPVDNVVIATNGLQDRTTNITAGTTVENKGKLILTEISHRCKNMIFKSIKKITAQKRLRNIKDITTLETITEKDTSYKKFT